jgi:hypothetical protein
MKKYISNTLLNYLREKTTFTQCIYSKQHLLRTTFTQNNISSKQHFLKTTFTQNNIYSKQHLLIIVSAVEKYWGYSFLFVYIPLRYHLKVIKRLLVGGGGVQTFVFCHLLSAFHKEMLKFTPADVTLSASILQSECIEDLPFNVDMLCILCSKHFHELGECNTLFS